MPERQLEDLRHALSTIPGAFVNETYRYSLRAYTYEERTGPSSTLMVQGLAGRASPDWLGFHQTSIDTAIVAREADKGRGLESLLSWLGIETGNSVAVGDSEPDLAMFHAGRCFVCAANLALGTWRNARVSPPAANRRLARDRPGACPTRQRSDHSRWIRGCASRPAQSLFLSLTGGRRPKALPSSEGPARSKGSPVFVE